MSHDLASVVISAPSGYGLDASAGASGQILPGVFRQNAGVRAADAIGFRGGFRENYTDPTTNEGLAVTVLEFSTAHEVQRYFRDSLPKTLNYVAPHTKPFADIPGAVELDGTKLFNGETVYGVVMTRGSRYALITYAILAQTIPPVEFSTWAQSQYRKLA